MRFRDDERLEVLARIARDPTQHITFGSHKGRIIITYDGLRVLLHRHLYRSAIGPLSDKEFLIKGCKEPGCQNPYHYAKSSTPYRMRTHCPNGHRYTTRDVPLPSGKRCRKCLYKGRDGVPMWQIQKARTHCPHGHPYSPGNTYTYPTPAGGTKRLCRTCVLARKHGEDPASVEYVTIRPRT